MNRLVLTGNGFDLAIGAKTNYSSFILDLKKKSLIDALDDKHTGKIKFNWQRKYRSTTEEINLINNLETNKGFRKFTRDRGIEITSENEFIKSLLKKDDKDGWVNIEQFYYDNLITSKDPFKLNEGLHFIANRLYVYLKEQQDAFKKDESRWWNQLRIKFSRRINKRNLKNFGKNIENTNLSEVCFLSFNYTNFIVKMTAELDELRKDINFTVNRIHGDLEENNTPIIFGYGDEHDSYYNELENKNENEYLRNIKSFHYLADDKYKDLLLFMNSGIFEILICGHSCEKSDKTLLKQIFEHPNRVSINPMIYKDELGLDDYEDKIMNISRLFEDKILMRELLVSKKRAETFPRQVMKTKRAD